MYVQTARGRVARSHEWAHGVFVDYDVDGVVLGVEVLAAADVTIDGKSQVRPY